MVERAFGLQISTQTMGPAQQITQLIWTICRRHASLGPFRNECMWRWFRSPKLHPTFCKSAPLGTTASPHRSRQSLFAKLSTKLQFLSEFVFFMFFFVYTRMYTVVVILFLIAISAVNTEFIWKTMLSLGLLSLGSLFSAAIANKNQDFAKGTGH